MYLQKLLSGYQRGHKNGCLFIVSGPSGAGKTVLCKTAASSLSRLFYSISYTTRIQRPQETDEKDYFFISHEKFKNKIKQDEFLEWAKVHGNYYGTSRRLIMDKITEGWDVILDIDVQGASQIYLQRKIPNCLIFVIPPSMDILTQRLTERKTDAKDDIAQRLKNAEEEIQAAGNYQYLIINNKLSDAVDNLTAIIKTYRSSLNLLPDDSA